MTLYSTHYQDFRAAKYHVKHKILANTPPWAGRHACSRHVHASKCRKSSTLMAAACVNHEQSVCFLLTGSRLQPAGKLDIYVQQKIRPQGCETWGRQKEASTVHGFRQAKCLHTSQVSIRLCHSTEVKAAVWTVCPAAWRSRVF